ncbi:MAG: CCA tRNA nucleotidyltransferase [Thermodesulfobacteriota bacterium]
MKSILNRAFFHHLDALPDTPGAYLVGGSVRDLLLNRRPEDLDIAVLSNPDAFAADLARRVGKRPIRIGKPGKQVFRVVTEPHTYDITQVDGPSIESDLKRRDFTVNALALSLSDKQMIDCTGGLDDLTQKRIRMVSEAAFVRDPIRLVRAYRFGAMLDFGIAPSTAEAIERHSSRIQDTAGERIWSELFKIFTRIQAHTWIIQMAKSGLLFGIFPDMKALQGCTQNRYHDFDVLDHTFQALGHLESILHRGTGIPGDIFEKIQPLVDKKRGALLKLAMLLHDLGKPATRTGDHRANIHFYGHEKTGAGIFEGIARRLKLSNFETRFTREMIHHHLKPLHLFNADRAGTLTRRGITRLFMRLQKNTPLLLLHALADARGKTAASPENRSDAYHTFIIKLLRDYFSQFQPRKALKPLITGHDLRREFGISPSPLFGRVLARIEEERLSDPSFGRQEALRLAERLIRETQNRD